jgi:hypothetical protein
MDAKLREDVTGCRRVRTRVLYNLALKRVRPSC